MQSLVNSRFGVVILVLLVVQIPAIGLRLRAGPSHSRLANWVSASIGMGQLAASGVFVTALGFSSSANRRLTPSQRW